MRPRVIPVLLVQNGGLVKGINFKKHTYIGDPVNAVKIFNEKEVDEIAIIDISRTVENKEPDYDLIAEITSEAFMPLSYGGGLRSIEQVRRILHSGVEKVVFNTSAYLCPELIRQTAREFGSSSTVVSIDVKSGGLFGGQKAYIQNATKKIDIDPVSYARQLEEMGAGEIILTSVNKEGTMSGYDNELIKLVASAVSVPVIANGGAGSLQHFTEAMKAGAAAIAAGSMFVFTGKIRGVLINYPSEAELNSIIK